MCARVGLIAREGLGTAIKDNYGKTMLIISAFAVLIPNLVTIGADLAGMAAGINLLVPRFPISAMVPVVAIIIAVVEILASYKTIERYLKWLLLILFAYVFAGFLAQPDWGQALYHTIIPTVKFDKTTLTAIIAVLGTTISPYLFFWQASEEVEEIQDEGAQAISKQELRSRLQEVSVGFTFTNIVFFFIILTTAATLNKQGIMSITSARQAAEALAPIAGNASSLLFALGIIGSGILAVPVLAGSTAYVVSEIFGWREGLNEKLRKAPGFYTVLVVSILIGTSIDLLHISPIGALYYSQVIGGLLVPILLVVIMRISNNKEIMNAHVNSRLMNVIGYTAIVSMTLAALLFIYLSIF
jgi:Mn2+/Fe2+ NRAMP family transporter